MEKILPGINNVSLRRFYFRSLTLFAMLAISGRAKADRLPLPNETAVACSAPGVCQSSTGSGVFGGELAAPPDTAGPLSGEIARASADTFNGPVPHLSVEISGNNLFLPNAPAASARMVYSFMVKPPDGTFDFNPVPLHVNYSISFLDTLDVDSNGDPVANFEVEGNVGLFSSTNVFTSSSLCGNGLACGSGDVGSDSITVSQVFGFTPDVVETVGMSAEIAFVSANTFDESFIAIVNIDPTITIDPAFLQQNPGYTLEFSDGIDGSGSPGPAPVPEPAAWGMMLIGFGGLGAVLRGARPAREFKHST
jgi:hypothetical protein